MDKEKFKQCQLKVYSRLKTVKCPICGKIEWGAHPTPFYVSTGEFSKDNPGQVNINTLMPYTSFICDNCGYIASFTLND